MRKSICRQAELGFQAYVLANVLGTVLQPCNVYAAHAVVANPLDALSNPTGFATLTTPFVVFTGSQPKQLAYDSGIYELKLSARLETQIDDEEDIPNQDVHADRIEALRDLLEDVDSLIYWMNYGETAPPVPGFSVTALVFDEEGERHFNQDRRLICELDYYLGASTVPSTGDGPPLVTVVSGDSGVIVGG